MIEGKINVVGLEDILGLFTWSQIAGVGRILVPLHRVSIAQRDGASLEVEDIARERADLKTDTVLFIAGGENIIIIKAAEGDAHAPGLRRIRSRGNRLQSRSAERHQTDRGHKFFHKLSSAFNPKECATTENCQLFTG